jgi:hypothetical protein
MMQARAAGRLTLDQREIVLLDEALEGVLLELEDIGSQTQRGQDGREDNAVTHDSGSGKNRSVKKIRVELG